MTNPIEDVAGEIADTVTRILKTDAEGAAGYSKLKADAIARYALLIGEAYAAGDLSEDAMRTELEELDRMAERFVRNIRALAHTAIEAPFEVVAQTLRGAIGAAVVSRAVPPPELPAPRL